MNKKQRDSVRYTADLVSFFEWMLYGLVLFWIVAAATSPVWEGSPGPSEQTLWGAAIFLSLLRLRLLIRSIRTDALIREAEEEDRRLLADATTEVQQRKSKEIPCPQCGIPAKIPSNYPHNQAKCPHCAHVFSVR